MEKKIAPEMTVVTKKLTTTMKNLTQSVGDLPKQIFAEALASKLHPTGPQYWIYEWLSEDMEAEFTLKICLPVATFGNNLSSETFTLEKLNAFNHVSKMHYGAWENLKDTYGSLMQAMQQAQIIPGNVCREVYMNCDFENPVNNITEVQFQVN